MVTPYYHPQSDCTNTGAPDYWQYSSGIWDFPWYEHLPGLMDVWPWSLVCQKPLAGLSGPFLVLLCREWIFRMHGSIWSWDVWKLLPFHLSSMGALRFHVKPTRGARQGDPISPYLFISSYLFIFCAKGLFLLLHDVVLSNALHSCRICHGTPQISHLLFVDDPIIFWGIVKAVLATYETASEHQVNLAKSRILFGKGIPVQRRDTPNPRY